MRGSSFIGSLAAMGLLAIAACQPATLQPGRLPALDEGKAVLTRGPDIDASDGAGLVAGDAAASGHGFMSGASRAAGGQGVAEGADGGGNSGTAGTWISRARGAVAVTVRWPYRIQTIPTSTELLRLELTGPSTYSLDIMRPAGAQPTSSATLSADVGSGYTLAARAYGGQRLLASGQKQGIDIFANKTTSVSLQLLPTYVPAVSAFAPVNGGPGAPVQVFGTNLGWDRALIPEITFGGIKATTVYPPAEGTVSVLVPEGGKTGPVGASLDGVAGAATGSFTVLSELALSPASATVASGEFVVFTAQATTAEGSPFSGVPAVVWSVTVPVSDVPILNQGRSAGGRINAVAGSRPRSAWGRDAGPGPTPPPAGIGTIDQTGRFRGHATGSSEVVIMSGRLMATASITVTP